jgi:hypothetical protein
MSTKLTLQSSPSGRLGMLVALASIVFLAAACGSPAASSTQAAAAPLDNAAPTALSAIVPTQASAPAIPSSNYPDACTVLTKDAVSKVLGTPVDSAASSGLGGVCTYTSTAASLKIDFTIAGHTGGIQAMKTQLARLGDLALVVPGLGDQAFYNTNPDIGSPLFLNKGDAEYLFSMSDTNYQPLDPAVIQATEKSLAEQLLSNLP